MTDMNVSSNDRTHEHLALSATNSFHESSLSGIIFVLITVVLFPPFFSSPSILFCPVRRCVYGATAGAAAVGADVSR
jgi:hypothetical protein